MNELCFVMIKPDAIQRKLIGKIVSRIDEIDLNIVKMELIKPDRDLIKRHYERKRHGCGTTLDKAMKYLSSGNIIKLLVSGKNAIKKIRNVVGEGTAGEECAEGAIRREFGTDSRIKADKENRAIENCIHASRTSIAAEEEIEIWFPDFKF